MPRNRRAIAAALVVVLVGVGAIVLAARHDKKGAGSTVLTTGSLPSSAAVNSTPPAGLSTSAFGISTGVQLYNEKPEQIDADIAGIAAIGSKWMRTAIRWDDVEAKSESVDDWSTADRIVRDARAHGVNLILDITGTPTWARAPGGGNVQFPPDLHTYARFTGKIAARYKGKVAAYELGNEPNHKKSFGNPDAKLYEKVLEYSYPVIKAADPATTVLTGGLGGIKDKNGVVPGDKYLEQLYQYGAKPYFDGLSYHPYSYPLLPSQDTGQRGWSHMLNARKIMVANGDADKKIWVTEYGAPTKGPNSVSPDEQAQIMYDAYRLWATYSWAGPLCWFDYRDKGTDTSDHGNFFGLYAKDGQPKVALTQYRTLVQSIR
jgi:hypothetical protein